MKYVIAGLGLFSFFTATIGVVLTILSMWGLDFRIGASVFLISGIVFFVCVLLDGLKHRV